jgi:hypothetical protein
MTDIGLAAMHIAAMSHSAQRMRQGGAECYTIA